MQTMEIQDSPCHQREQQHHQQERQRQQHHHHQSLTRVKKNPLRSSAWVDHAVLSIATACNLCDVYTHSQVQHEVDMQESDRNFAAATLLASGGSFDDMERDLQVQVYRKVLFDESSIRLDDLDGCDDDDQQQQQQASSP